MCAHYSENYIRWHRHSLSAQKHECTSRVENKYRTLHRPALNTSTFHSWAEGSISKPQWLLTSHAKFLASVVAGGWWHTIANRTRVALVRFDQRRHDPSDRRRWQHRHDNNVCEGWESQNISHDIWVKGIFSLTLWYCRPEANNDS
jgi:hypothetical protein